MNLAQPERTSGRGKSFPRVADYLWSVSVVPAPLSVLLHPAVGLIGSSLTICHWFIFFISPREEGIFFLFALCQGLCSAALAHSKN